MSTKQPIAALVLAGAPNRGPLASVSDSPYEALIEIEGRPMIAYVLDALRQAPSIGPIGIVGPVEELAAALDVKDEQLISPVGSLLDNLEHGARALLGEGSAGRERLLVITSDIPLVTTEAIEDFVERCRRRDKEAGGPGSLDAFYPMVSRESSEARFPSGRRTYVSLREGVYTGGNCVLLSPEVLLKQRPLFEQAVALRKDPVGMARLLGLGFIIKFLMRRLSAADIERVVRQKLGINGAIIPVPYAEIGFDVDKPKDLELARRALAGR
ncbi:MAG: hypothetical protein BAA04_13475 [Firmicutes bacterium ZCTH02-B6]|nr:MAG: hypothetical protein BAA04_13475 [Firmicutes bacterium ZCTH02-B6]